MDRAQTTVSGGGNQSLLSKPGGKLDAPTTFYLLRQKLNNYNLLSLTQV